MTSHMKDSITQAFSELSLLPSEDTVNRHLGVIEKLVIAVYRGDTGVDIDANRFDLFSTSAAGNVREIPPSKNALKLHIMRSAYQSGWVWRNTLSASTPPSVLEWGWEIVQDEDQLTLKWVEEIPIPEYLMLANVIKNM